MIESNFCPLCGEFDQFILITYRENVPVGQNFLMPTPEAAYAVPRGTLDIVMCSHCTFVFNRAFESDKVDYSKDYENKQYLSSVFLDYLQELWVLLKDKYKVTPANCLLEVGCGQGFFLEEAIRQLGVTGIGFDPAYRSQDKAGSVAQYYSEYYTSEHKGIGADIILSRHVIEHISDPRTFLKDLSHAISNESVQLFLETPDIHWILENQVVWDFFYEHCSYFSPYTLSYAAALAGFDTQDVQSVFKDQYMWFSGCPGRTQTLHLEEGDKVKALTLARTYFEYEHQIFQYIIYTFRLPIHNSMQQYLNISGGFGGGIN